MRVWQEALEAKIISPYGIQSANTRGRIKQEEPCKYRTEMQRDRDRVIYSKAFRRLKHKTQVFIAPEGDHYRTRLTHTLEVAQIARTVARSLRLNEDLTEAIALGHDLGHTPFGHAGEAVLNAIHPGGFRHNVQSLRVVDQLESLNLTWEVRDGILNHTGTELPATLEGQTVRICDRIAYINHDIDDAIRAGVLTVDQLPSKPLAALGDTTRQRINTLVSNLIDNSFEKSTVSLDADLGAALDTMRDFMFARVYIGSDPKQEDAKAKRIVELLYAYFLEHYAEIPDRLQDRIQPRQGLCDYIAGMTDRYAISLFKSLFLPVPWQG